MNQEQIIILLEKIEEKMLQLYLAIAPAASYSGEERIENRFADADELIQEIRGIMDESERTHGWRLHE